MVYLGLLIPVVLCLQIPKFGEVFLESHKIPIVSQSTEPLWAISPGIVTRSLKGGLKGYDDCSSEEPGLEEVKWLLQGHTGQLELVVREH